MLIQKDNMSAAITVGVSVFIGGNAEAIFNSGVQQNALFLSELLLNMGNQVYLISNSIESEANIDIIKYDARFNVITDKDIFSYIFDVILIVGYDFLYPEHIAVLKANKTKIVFYKCSIDYLLDCEAFCYNIKRGIFHKQGCYDQIWSIPQNYELNSYYWKTLYKCDVIQAPFVWSEKLIDKEEWIYKPDNSTKRRIAIFEPNISIIKCAIAPLLICENAYRIEKNIDKVFVTNMLDVKLDKNVDASALESFVLHFDLQKDNKIFIEDRYRTIPMMKYSADIAVSHTVCNPLNYLYLELGWMGYAVVHNAPMCKEIGYYYRDNNFEEAGDILNKTIKMHDANVEEYITRNRSYIDKFRPGNEELQHAYKKLFDDLLKL